MCLETLPSDITAGHAMQACVKRMLFVMMAHL